MACTLSKNNYIPQVAVGFLFIFVLLQMMSADPYRVGLTSDYNWGMLTYPFFHANWLHLLINWWCLMGLVLTWKYKWKYLALCLLIAWTYPFAGDTPILGLSGFLFALCGFSVGRWHSNPRRASTCMAIFIGITALLPHVGWGIHAWCYAIALVFSYGIRIGSGHTEGE